MKPVQSFEEFIRQGIVKKQIKNAPRSEFLVKESEQDYSFLLRLLKEFSIDDKNANNFIKSCYDILMQLIRAKMLLDGYGASGQGAHEAELSYLRVLGFKEIDVQFANQVRFFRNGMIYYGTILDKVYAEKVVDFTKRLYPKLLDLNKK